jgi:hypothetical protein
MLNIYTDFDGATPQKKSISKIGKSEFEVKAFSETDREAFRLEIGIKNTGTVPANIKLNITWPTEPFSELRDCFYWNNTPDKDWIPVFAQTGPGKSVIEFSVPPGKGLLCLHPHYGYDDSESYLHSVGDPRAKVNVFGYSQNGRNMTLLQAGKSDNPKFRYLISARNHANESSGCYCVEGMIDWLLSGEPLAEYALRIADFTFVPMSNPDGVSEGMARYTGTRCADMHRTAEWNAENQPGSMPDKAHDAYFKLIDEIKPTHFINFHSYLFKFKDEIFATDQETVDQFKRFMPDQIDFGKTWLPQITDHTTFPTGYAYKKYGTLPLMFEVPWFGRNAATMRETGKRILRASLLMNSLRGRSAWGNL